MFLALVSLFKRSAYGFLAFGAYDLRKVSTIDPTSLWTGLTVVRPLLDQRVIFVVSVAFTRVERGMRTPMLLAQDTVFLGSALSGLFWNAGVNQLHLTLTFCPLWLVIVLGLCIHFLIVLYVL